MNIAAESAQLVARGVVVSPYVELQELRLTGTGVSLTDTGAVRVEDATATLIATEAALNRLLGGLDLEDARDLEIATLTGRVRVTGKWTQVGGIPVPFSMTGVPEIEGGARLQVSWQQISVIGLPIPAVGVSAIGERINRRLAEAIDITRLPIPLRLTSLSVEPGRVLLTAAASVEVAPREGALARASSPSG